MGLSPILHIWQRPSRGCHGHWVINETQGTMTVLGITLKMRAFFVRLTTVLWALFLSIACVLMSPVSIAGEKSGEAIYFVAGTITSGGYIQTYPVTLYRIGTQHKLALVRQIHSSQQGLIDFAEDLHGRIYFVGSGAKDAVMTILHESDPERVDVVSLEDFSDAMCWGAVGGENVPMGVQYCPGDKIIRVLGDAEPDKRRTVLGNWALFKRLQYGGDIGGPFQAIGPALRVVRGNLVLPGNLQAPRVVLSELPPGVDAKTFEGRGGGVLASTDRFLVLLMEPSEFMNTTAVTTGDPGHAGPPLHIHIHDKLSDQWRVLDLPTTVTGLANAPIRIFDPWLVTSVAEWRPGPDENPGHDQERKWSNAQFPDVNGGYGSLFIDLFLPGRLILDNLTDGRRIALETGQEDSEVLAIENDGRILYRANDSIYLAKIDGTQIKAPTLFVKDADVPELHWAFWGPATRSGTATRKLHVYGAFSLVNETKRHTSRVTDLSPISGNR